MIKTLLPCNDTYLQFTEEELAELGLKQGDKFTAKPQEDGSIFLEKYKEIEIDLDEFSPEVNKMLVKRSIKMKLPVDEVIVELLKQYMEENPL